MKINYWGLKGFLTSLCLIFLLNLHAQQKKTLSVQDYHLWQSSPKIMAAEAADDGNWYTYQTGHDSLVTITLKKINGPSAYRFTAKTNPNQNRAFSLEIKSNFSQDSKHFAFISNDTLQVINLNTGQLNSYKGFKDFRFVGQGKFLVAEADLPNSKDIVLWDLKNQQSTTIPEVEQFVINLTKNSIALVTKQANNQVVKTVDFKPGFPASVIASTTNNTYTKLTWNNKGTTLTFAEIKGAKLSDKVYKIYACTFPAGKPLLKTIDPAAGVNLPESYYCSADDKLYLSPDGSQLFFYLIKPIAAKPKYNQHKKTGVEVWLPTDPDLDYRENREDRQLWCQYTLANGKLMPVTDTVFNCAKLTGDGQHVLLYHKHGYLPRHKYVNKFIDIYIKDLKTGTSKLLLKKVWDQPDQISISPGGKYLAYYKDKNWWVYDIYQQKHRCLTEGFNNPLQNPNYDEPGTIPPYGNPGWLQNDRQLIVYDKNDIWLLNADDNNREKITNGASTDQTFRIFKQSNARNPFAGPGESFFNNIVYDENEGLVIKSINNQNYDNGMYLWTRKAKLTELRNQPMKFKFYGDIRPGKPFLFSESSFETPPRLMLHHPAGKTELLYQTDPHQKDYQWGKSELINFSTPDGKQLKGALFYPANYISGKRYPMIVSIYEKQSKDLHDYQIPSIDKNDALNGVNITNYNAEGYLVFLPDIDYEFNNPGISATKCVVAGVEKVIEMGLADRQNIGLMGHSFGGYETAFIATQTDLFKTAIASAGITDISSWAVLISQFGPNFTRIEEDQFRMTGKFQGDDYVRNSPMHYIHQMKTPILLWSGDKDTNVDVSQTKSFHTALWRLGKQSTMLIYKGENHVLISPDNQTDLDRRVKNWFDHYLKGVPAADWMVRHAEKSK
ncbi:Prolyl oligopeptidase family protein [compost metagenome]